jgi:hypothetical protein
MVISRIGGVQVSTGAGGCAVAAAMFGEEVKKNYDAGKYRRIVAVVCGGCMDTEVLMRICGKVF